MKSGMKKVVALAAVLVAVGSLVMATVMPGPVAAEQPDGQQGYQGQPGNQGGASGQPGGPSGNPQKP